MVIGVRKVLELNLVTKIITYISGNRSVLEVQSLFIKFRD
jgi:hypothetical protein